MRAEQSRPASAPTNAREDFRAAANIYRVARRAGRTIRSLNDCLIAAVAIRHEAKIVHRDADFDVFASITPLVLN